MVSTLSSFFGSANNQIWFCGAFAQTGPAPYGSPITLEQAKKAMVAAEAEARKNNWQVVISIVDSGGHLVMLQRLDAQTGSIEIATGKAATSAALRRPTKAIEDSLAPGGSALRILSVRSVTALQGGVPILLDGKIIGAIGVSAAGTWNAARPTNRFCTSRRASASGRSARRPALAQQSLLK